MAPLYEHYCGDCETYFRAIRLSRGEVGHCVQCGSANVSSVPPGRRGG